MWRQGLVLIAFEGTMKKRNSSVRRRRLSVYETDSYMGKNVEMERYQGTDRGRATNSSH